MNKKSRELLIKSFDNINNWDCDKYTLWNESIGIELWMASGRFFFESYHNIVFKNRSRIQIDFSFVDKMLIYPKAKKLMKEIEYYKIRKSLE